MTNDQKLILCVGNSFGSDYNKEYFELEGGGEIVVGEIARDVVRAIDGINSGNYWGLLMSSLVLPLGENEDGYSERMEKYKEFDGPGSVLRSTGFYVLEKARESGLVSVVNSVAGENIMLGEVQIPGAVCFNGLAPNLCKTNLEYFQSLL